MLVEVGTEAAVEEEEAEAEREAEREAAMEREVAVRVSEEKDKLEATFAAREHRLEAEHKAREQRLLQRIRDLEGGSGSQGGQRKGGSGVSPDKARSRPAHPAVTNANTNKAPSEDVECSVCDTTFRSASERTSIRPRSSVRSRDTSTRCVGSRFCLANNPARQSITSFRFEARSTSGQKSSECFASCRRTEMALATTGVE